MNLAIWRSLPLLFLDSMNLLTGYALPPIYGYTCICLFLRRVLVFQVVRGGIHYPPRYLFCSLVAQNREYRDHRGAEIRTPHPYRLVFPALLSLLALALYILHLASRVDVHQNRNDACILFVKRTYKFWNDTIHTLAQPVCVHSCIHGSSIVHWGVMHCLREILFHRQCKQQFLTPVACCVYLYCGIQRSSIVC